MGSVGCLGFDPTGCDSMESASVKAQRVTLSESKERAIDPIEYSELSEGEQEIVRTAIAEDEYRKCPAADPAIPEPLQSLSTKASEHLTEDDHVYLRYNGAFYALAVTIEDEVYSFLPD